ncbi:unnamed protein product [Dracunculus medinensis]|uniref:Kinesin motor domain-containing protein n=1 Tax=Dracunculus medinensis TaxID=318479 RepID=A0A0N4U4I8_DRAME|nr:unnamed protein product [Dracunculus medinensis]
MKITKLTDELTKLQCICQVNDAQIVELHNKIVDLKGKIRICVRVRPLLSEEISAGETSEHINIANDKTIKINHHGQVSSFEFQRIWSQNDTQQTIFNDVKELIESSLHGFNVAIMAYGQTGSGKTYVMEGDVGGCEGILPRALKFIFDRRSQLILRNWEVEIECARYEFYNNKCYDLLAHGGPRMAEVHFANGRSEIHQLSRHTILNIEQGLELLSKSRLLRTTATTLCSPQSSRSHSIFEFTIKVKNSSSDYESFLSLVDLAGSERINESGASGAQITEAISINRSLSDLRNVIRAKMENFSHVPYRNNKLTIALAKTLGCSSSKTLLIIALRPTLSAALETRRSLEFANVANSTKIGAAVKQQTTK